MKLKWETLLLFYTDSDQTIACRVRCKSLSTNEGLNKTCRLLSNNEWQLFDDCIEKSLNAHKRRKTKMNFTYNLDNIDITITESRISYRELKDFIYEYDDLIHSNIKHIWDCCVTTKQNCNKYEPLATHCFGNYVPFKPIVDVEEEIDLRNYIQEDIVVNDDTYQPMSLDSTNSERVSPQYKPSPIKSKTNTPNNNDEVMLMSDCDKTLVNATLLLQLPHKSLEAEHKGINKPKNEMKYLGEAEYIPGSQKISDSSKVSNVPAYIPTPISCTSFTKQSTSSFSSASSTSKIIDDTKKQVKRVLHKSECRIVTKMESRKSYKKMNAITNWNIDDVNFNVVALRRSARPQRLIETPINNDKCDKNEKRDKNVKVKSIKLSAKHKELFGSDDDNDDDNFVNNNKRFICTINSNTKNKDNNDDNDRKIKKKHKRDPSPTSGVKETQKSYAKNCSKSTKERAKMEKGTNNDRRDRCPDKSNDVGNKYIPHGRECLPTKEEVEKREKSNTLRQEQALKWRKRLHQMHPREIKVTQYLTLNDMTLEEIMITFEKYKPYLDEIYMKCCKKSYVKSFNGLDHCFVFNLIEETFQAKMLQKLCEIYCRHSNTTHPTMLGNAILPEWLMRIFMHKHQLSRQEAIEQIKSQENSLLSADENDSLFNFEL